MLSPLLIVSQSDSLIQIVDINSHTKWQTVQIQISWLLQKPTDLELHCLQRQGRSGFSRTRVNEIYGCVTLYMYIPMCLTFVFLLPPLQIKFWSLTTIYLPSGTSVTTSVTTSVVTSKAKILTNQISYIFEYCCNSSNCMRFGYPWFFRVLWETTNLNKSPQGCNSFNWVKQPSRFAYTMEQ